MLESRKSRLTFVKNGKFVVCVAVFLSIIVLSSIFYFFPQHKVTFEDTSREYKRIATAVLIGNEGGKFSVTLGGRGTYATPVNYGATTENKTYYYSENDKEKIISVNNVFDILSYKYSITEGKGVLYGYYLNKVVFSVIPAVLFTIIEFLVGAAAFGIAAMPGYLERRYKRRNSDSGGD